MSENACQTAQERVCRPIAAAHEQDTTSDGTGPQNGPEWTVESLAGLRVYVGRHARMDEMTKAALLVYAREIEREVKELTDERDLLKTQWEAGVDFDQRLESCADKREDVTLFGVDYTALPVDADGVPIHVGDVMENIVCPSVHREVTGVGVECFYGWDDGNGRYSQFDVNCYRHHHAPTVEDVLREFAEGLGVPVANSYIAVTAAKLRLAGEGE